MAYCEKCEKGFDRDHDDDTPGTCPRCHPFSMTWRTKVSIIALMFGIILLGLATWKIIDLITSITG